MGRYNHSLSLDATIMVSKHCPIIGEDVGIIFVTQYVTIANVFILSTFDKHDKMQLWAKFKKILYMGFRATLNFRKIKVALNPMYRIFLNFAKSCILSCLSKVNNIKKIHRAVLEIYAPKAAVKGVFRRSSCCYGNLLCHENDTSVFTNDWSVF